MRTAVLVALLSAGPASAHKLVVTVAPTSPDRLRVTAAYDDGSPADGATATLTVGDAPPVRAVLDDAGTAELAAPPGDWRLTVDDGVGHRTTVRGTTNRPVAAPADRRKWAAAAGCGLIALWATWRRAARYRAPDCATPASQSGKA